MSNYKPIESMRHYCFIDNAIHIHKRVLATDFRVMAQQVFICFGSDGRISDYRFCFRYTRSNGHRGWFHVLLLATLLR